MGQKFELYMDKIGGWRWHFRASNNRIIADSGEGYKNKGDAEHGIDLVKEEAPDAPVVEVSRPMEPVIPVKRLERVVRPLEPSISLKRLKEVGRRLKKKRV